MMRSPSDARSRISIHRQCSTPMVWIAWDYCETVHFDKGERFAAAPHAEPREPGTGAMPAIEDVAHLACPLSCGPGKPPLLLLALLPLDSFLSSPPAHGYPLRPALFASQQQAFPFKPTHARLS